MKKRSILTAASLLLIILTLAGCSPKANNGGKTENDHPSDLSCVNEAVKIVCGQETVTLDEDEAKIIRDALCSAEWKETGPCDCMPLCIIFVGETNYSFKNDHIECGMKSTSDEYAVIEAVLKKHFSLTDEWEMPTVKIVERLYVEGLYSENTIFLDEEDAQALLNALSSLEWIDTGDSCNCSPIFSIFVGEAIYHYHSPYHASHGSWVRGTKEAKDIDRKVEDIVKKYLPTYWNYP